MDNPFRLEIPDIVTEELFFTDTPEEFPNRLGGQWFLTLNCWRWDLKTGELTPFYCYTNGNVILTIEAVEEILRLSDAISLHAEEQEGTPL